ncbi:MAG TPA: sigma-70 family RNA polymerase sigma factor [Acidimicrobiia bacterium]|nr:sigma-70 family RNA polymerase sigma factor [Acidimicrobiia bacterium]
MANGRVRPVSDTEDSVRLYLDEIGRYPLLTKDDEARLAREIESGRAAREALRDAQAVLSRAERRELERTARGGDQAWLAFVQANLRLVVSIARKYQSSGLPLLDLIQEGNLGLMHAVDKFDWRKGFKFSTYATWWIRQAIQRGVANTAKVVRLPAQAEDELARLRRAWATAQDREGGLPSREELATASGLSLRRVDDLMPYLGDVLSLDQPVDDAGETVVGDLVADRAAEAPDDVVVRSVLAPAVERMLSVLDDEDREVLALRFGLDRGEPRTPAEVADLVNIGRERVRQIEQRALARLRRSARESEAAELLAG